MAYEDDAGYQDYLDEKEAAGRARPANLIAPPRNVLQARNSTGLAVGDINPQTGGRVAAITQAPQSQELRSLGFAALARERAQQGIERIAGSSATAEPAAPGTGGYGPSSESSWRNFFGPKPVEQPYSPAANRATTALMASRGLRPGGSDVAGTFRNGNFPADREERDTSSYKPNYFRATRDPVTGGTMIVDLRSRNPFANPRILPNTKAPKNPMNIPGTARPQGTARSVGQLTEIKDDGREVRIAGADGRNQILDFMPGGKYSSYGKKRNPQ